MESISFGEAAERFGELIGKAEAGETITITRDGQPVASLVPTAEAGGGEQAAATPEAKPRKRIDVDALRALTSKMNYQPTSAGELMRELRDSDRY